MRNARTEVSVQEFCVQLCQQCRIQPVTFIFLFFSGSPSIRLIPQANKP